MNPEKNSDDMPGYKRNNLRYRKPPQIRACTKVLLDIQNEELKSYSSMLVLVETINVLLKLNKALKADEQKQLDINFPIIKRVAEYNYRITGADYIHIATMEINNIGKIISADEELDKVDIVKRIDPLKY